MAEQRRFVRRSEFAALQGCSRPYVTELGHKGLLVLSDDGRLVDVDATRARLAQFADPARESTRLRHNAARIERDTGVKAPVLEPPPPGAAAAGSDPQYWDRRARREGALAALAELELAQRRGDMVSKAEVESMGYTIGRTFRDTLLGLPTRLAPLLAASTDVDETEQMLNDALRLALTDFEGTLASSMSRLGDQ